MGGSVNESPAPAACGGLGDGNERSAGCPSSQQEIIAAIAVHIQDSAQTLPNRVGIFSGSARVWSAVCASVEVVFPEQWSPVRPESGEVA